MIACFELTMPNIGSWNGRWTGEGKKYYVIQHVYKKQESGKRILELLDGKESVSFYHRWEDGWGANVRLELIDAGERRRRQKVSAGFCGYNWMIDSIIKHGKIIIESKSGGG
jgi:hypothetical protein